METAPVKYQDSVRTLSRIYDSIEDDIKRLRDNNLDLNKARVILAGRRAQLRTAEVALAAQRLFLQYEKDRDKAGKLKKKAS